MKDGGIYFGRKNIPRILYSRACTPMNYKQISTHAYMRILAIETPMQVFQIRAAWSDDSEFHSYHIVLLYVGSNYTGMYQYTYACYLRHVRTSIHVIVVYVTANNAQKYCFETAVYKLYSQYIGCGAEKSMHIRIPKVFSIINQ